MSDVVTRLNAALEGRYLVEREIGEGGMATRFEDCYRNEASRTKFFRSLKGTQHEDRHPQENHRALPSGPTGQAKAWASNFLPN